MLSFKEFIAEENGIDYFVIEFNKIQFPKLDLISEGRWESSGKKDWMVRRDSENPMIQQQGHVHIARAKHTKNKIKQASWNQDATKHDKKNFNSKIGSLRVVQSIARQVLKLPNDTYLEEQSLATNILILLNESYACDVTPVVFRLKKE